MPHLHNTETTSVQSPLVALYMLNHVFQRRSGQRQCPLNTVLAHDPVSQPVQHLHLGDGPCVGRVKPLTVNDSAQDHTETPIGFMARQEEARRRTHVDRTEAMHDICDGARLKSERHARTYHLATPHPQRTQPCRRGM